MKGAAWRGHGGVSVSDHLGLAGARRARLCIYGVALSFAAFAAFLAFAPSLPAPPPTSPSAAWLDGDLASASPYRAQVSGFFSSLFPANSSSFFPTSPPGPGVVAARRSGPGRGGLAAGGGQAGGNNGSSAGRPGEKSGGGGGVPGANSGGVRGGDSAPAGNGTATSAVKSDAPPSVHVGGGAAASNSAEIADAAANNSSGIAGPEAKAGAGIGVTVGGNSGAVRGDDSAPGNATTTSAATSDHVGGGAAASNSSGIAAAAAGSGATVGGSAQNGTTAAEGGEPVRINSSEVNASSAEARTSSGAAAVPSINQIRSAVSEILYGNVAAPHKRGHPGKNHTAQGSAAGNDQQQSGNRAPAGAAVSSGGSNSTKAMHKEATAASQRSATNSSAVPVMGNGRPGPAKQAADAGDETKKLHWIEAMCRCDMFYGNWVRDDSYPLYPEGSCPHVDESFNCHLNGRPDKAYQRLRWQPSGCSIPRLNPTDMLERLRGKRLVFVGDSLNRNMWESLVCILRNSVRDKRRVFEVSGNRKFRAEGSYSFLFQDYNCTVEFFRSPFLVQEWEMPVSHGKKKETLRLDKIDRSSSRYKNADVIVFNTGHWWTHEKTSLGKDYYQEGNQVYSELNVHDAYRRALNTWAKWVDSNVNPRRTTVLFRGYSSSHFSGGQWNSGGNCDKETEPITNEQYLMPYPQKMSILEEVLHGMKTPVAYLNITRMTDYRKEGHPSVYRKQKLSEEERKSPQLYQDCSHWCLPGVPDSWNELLYAQIIVKQHEMLHK